MRGRCAKRGRGAGDCALDQVTLLGLGNSVDVQCRYYPAEEGNQRLQEILAPGLLNLEYAYDPVGNVTLITDTLNSGQVQCFGYPVQSAPDCAIRRIG